MRALFLLLVAELVLTQGAVPMTSANDAHTVYDVTTVYKMRGDDAAAETRGLVEVADCFLGGKTCAWSTTNWTESEAQVFEVALTTDQKPHVMRIPSNIFSISVRPRTSSEDFFIFLMAETDIDHSNILVLQIRGQNKGYSQAFKCLQKTGDLGGLTALPTTPKRQCAVLSTFYSGFSYLDPAIHEFFRVELAGGALRVIREKDQNIVYDIYLPESFEELVGVISWVGISLNGDFKYSLPVDVLALSRGNGLLLSPVMTPPKPSSLLCVEMSAYLYPDSGASVAMSLKFTNGTILNVGEIRPSKNKVVTWRFMSDFQADKDQTFRIQVDANKENSQSVTLAGITTCNVTGEFNNLVFHQPGPAEVHIRGNARGLPLLLPNGTTTGPKVGVRIPECSLNSQGCGWTKTNFTRTTGNAGNKALLRLSSVSDFLDSTSKETRFTHPREFSPPLNFTFDVSRGDSNANVGIFLMNSEHDLRKGDMYFLHIRHNNYGYSYLYKCTLTDRSTPVSLPGGFKRSCSEKASHNFPWSFSTDYKFTFNIETNDGRIVLTVTYGGTKRVVFDWTDSDPIEMTHFAFGSDNCYGTLRGIPAYSVFSLSKKTGTLTSPPLLPSLERVCVSLAFHTTSMDDAIDLHLLQGDVETPLGTFTSGRARVMADLPSSSRGDRRLVVRATREQLDSPLYIQWIGGCNPEAPEDLVLMTNQTTLVAVDVSHLYEYATVALPTCSNGGVRTRSGECVCRPGFTGHTCSEGCGANSYGSDCKGVCSESSVTGCRGLALCKPILGCDCGPGYKGLLCDTSCGSGEYGAGCRQRCGHCAGESCDAYTGVCHHGCQRGRYPPFCHILYAHISSPPVVTVNGFYEANVKANLVDLKGQGKPQFYQIQYKEDNASTWIHGVPQKLLFPENNPPQYESQHISRTQQAYAMTSPRDLSHVTGLKPGAKYLLRVVLIDETLASYQGSHVPATAFTTPCIVPSEADYLLYNNQNDANTVRSVHVGNEGFEVEWKVSRGNVTWCPLIGYELHVKADWRKMVHSVSSDVTRKVVTGLSPGKEYSVKVRGVTSRGPAAFSQSLTITTSDLAPDHVLKLRATQTTERGISISWEKPRNTAGVIRSYLIKYQCLQLGACPEVDCGGSLGELKVTATSTQLDDLLPYALYNVSVAGISGSLGQTSSIQAVTTLGTPDVAPSSAAPGILSRSNSSLTVQWTPPSSCRQLNGYLTGYRYELFPAGQKSPLLVGTTTNHKASFSGLEPHTEFLVRVFAINSVGWSSTQALEINAKTRATTPEVVENLTVYKRGRRFLGLRWSPPRLTYGSLESFTVSHRPLDDETVKPVTATLKPSPCPAWPHLYCHTVKNLKADADYTLAVQARNSEVPEDGDEVTIRATTKEGAPGAPTYLRVLNKTDVSMTIEWGLPNLVNGQLRSFLVNIEETDSHNSSDCCQYFPLREVIVTEEKLSYQFQMTGLKAVSSYEVGVTAKTVSLGPALSITEHTRPATPVLTHAPELAEPVIVGQNPKVRVHPVQGYEAELTSGYLLLLKTETGTDDATTPIMDDWLANELKSALNGSFSLAAEFTHADLPESRTVELHPGQPMVDGVFGSVGLSPLVPNVRYQPVWVLVLEYCGARSVGHIPGVPFTVPQA